MQIIYCLLVTMLCSPSTVLGVSLNTSSTLNPLHFAETAANEFYPFMYEVPPVISIIMENETLRKNTSFSYGNPYFDLKQQIIGDIGYWKIQYCGVHFLDKQNGYILSPELLDDSDQHLGICGKEFANYLRSRIVCCNESPRLTL